MVHLYTTGPSSSLSTQFITPTPSIPLINEPCTPSDNMCGTSRSEPLKYIFFVVVTLSGFVMVTIIVIIISILLLCLRGRKKKTGLTEIVTYNRHDNEVNMDIDNRHDDEVNMDVETVIDTEITDSAYSVPTDSHSEPSLDSAIDVPATSAFDMISSSDNPAYNTITASSGSTHSYSELSSSTNSAGHIATSRNEAYISTYISTTDNPAYQPTQDIDNDIGSLKYDYVTIHKEDTLTENSPVYDYPRFMQ